MSRGFGPCTDARYNEGPREWQNMFAGCCMLQNCLQKNCMYLVLGSRTLSRVFHDAWLPHVKRKSIEIDA